LKEEGIAHKTNDQKFTGVEAGLTLCECLIARTGGIMVSSRQMAGRRLTIYPPVHMVVAYTSQLLLDIKDGLTFMQEKYASHLPSMISMMTGPSRTADIEKTLVLGAHGPKELVLFLVEDQL
jgi:L-lactate dehydrogenase complex protein LldG